MKTLFSIPNLQIQDLKLQDPKNLYNPHQVPKSQKSDSKAPFSTLKHPYSHYLTSPKAQPISKNSLNSPCLAPQNSLKASHFLTHFPSHRRHPSNTYGLKVQQLSRGSLANNPSLGIQYKLALGRSSKHMLIGTRLNNCMFLTAKFLETTKYQINLVNRRLQYLIALQRSVGRTLRAC